MREKTAVCLLAILLLVLAATPCQAQRRAKRDMMDAGARIEKAVVPWLIGMLLIVLASLPLFKKSKRAGYQDR